MKVTVTQDDIQRGTELRQANRFYTAGRDCPIAQALRRLFSTSDVVAGRGRIWVGGASYVTPPAAEAFMFRFDGGEPVEPFEFEL